jgi:hypothetical protein
VRQKLILLSSENIGTLLIVCALVTLAFLAYSLTHLKSQNRQWTHPRVLLELILFLIFFISGVVLIV